MSSELVISGIGVSQAVVSTIVSQAVERVEGVASVGENAIASSLISVFTSQPAAGEPPVESEVIDDKLHVSVRLSVFYGYPFTKLAEDVRSAVASAVKGQMGVEIGAVDVCIDNLVFPKE
ncbi:MAG: Asp23/Gls24 family envelope stress response protein [Atopobiaceae bacterium]|nr:Asp23/Gls24 family envelope stress response protein [Atopobiaceae bacterium]MBR3315441.1 Asp23/Gls24 family envelope stress response protein [Atopobiaceae bacterium]